MNKEMDFKKIFEEVSSNNVSMAILGPSGCGKTTLLKYILSQASTHINNIFVVQGSVPSKDNIYIDCVWPDDIFYYTKGEGKKDMSGALLKHLNELMVYQSEINQSIENFNRKEQKNQTNFKPYPTLNTLIIFDDMRQDTNKFYDMINVSRHSNIATIFLIHADTDMKPAFRKNISHFIVSIGTDLNQFADTGKEFVDNFNLIKNDTQRPKTKAFLGYDKVNKTTHFVQVTADEKKLLEKNFKYSVFTHASKQREEFVKSLQKIANEIRTTMI